jgi:hypothetical protein
MKFEEKDVTLRGIFELRIIKNGTVIEQYKDENMIMNVAKDALAKLIGGDGSGKAVTKIGFGTNGSGPTPDDTALTNAHVKSISSRSYPQVGQVRFNFNLATTEANEKTIREFGLICSDNTLFARKTRGAIEKSSDIAFEGSWTIIF